MRKYWIKITLFSVLCSLLLWLCLFVHKSMREEYYQSGFHASRAGVGANCNPCTSGPSRRAWLKGWIAAVDPEVEEQERSSFTVRLTDTEGSL